MYTVDLPCKPGDDFWWVDEDTLEIHHEKGGIKGVVVYLDKPVEIIDADGERSETGTCWCCLSLEEAETIREKMLQE